jgi:hypothetical protein
MSRGSQAPKARADMANQLQQAEQDGWRTFREHLQCSNCEYDLYGLVHQPAVEKWSGGVRERWQITCPECGRVYPEIVYRLHEHPQETPCPQHIPCKHCGCDLYQIMIQPHGEIQCNQAVVRWMVKCPECETTQNSFGRPDAVVGRLLSQLSSRDLYATLPLAGCLLVSTLILWGPWNL